MRRGHHGHGAGAAAATAALLAGYQYAQAGHAALELLELADVDHDGMETEVGDHGRGSRRGCGDEDVGVAEHHDVRAGLFAD